MLGVVSNHSTSGGFIFQKIRFSADYFFAEIWHLAELAQTKPTTVENIPHIALYRLFWSHGARVVAQCHFPAAVYKQGQLYFRFADARACSGSPLRS